MPQFELKNDHDDSWFDSRDEFVQAYVTTMFWAEQLDSVDVFNLSSDARSKICADCMKFQASPAFKIARDNGAELEQMGHDFWLTRNGYGAGFWDRGDYYQPKGMGDRLSDVARSYGESYAYVGDDGLVYVD